MPRKLFKNRIAEDGRALELRKLNAALAACRHTKIKEDGSVIVAQTATTETVDYEALTIGISSR